MANKKNGRRNISQESTGMDLHQKRRGVGVEVRVKGRGGGIGGMKEGIMGQGRRSGREFIGKGRCRQGGLVCDTERRKE